MTSDPRETLTRIRARAIFATEGPWAPWLDQDGTEHMNGLLMVGNADGVIPEGESWIEDVDVNPIAHTYTPEDREFIAHARTDVPRLVAFAEAVLDLADPDYPPPPPDDRGAAGWRFAMEHIYAFAREHLGDDDE